MESICKPSLLWQMVFPRFQFSIMRKTNVQDDMVYHSWLSCYVRWMANKVMWCYNCLFSWCNCLQLEEGLLVFVIPQCCNKTCIHPIHPLSAWMVILQLAHSVVSQRFVCVISPPSFVSVQSLPSHVSLLIVQPLAQHTRVSTGSKMTLYLENFFVTLEWIGLLQFFFGGSALLSNLITCPR